MSEYTDGYDAGIVDANRECIDKVGKLLDKIYDRTVDTQTVEDVAYAKQIISDFQKKKEKQRNSN